MENTSLNPRKCGFCAHVNPAHSRYCNACGAPLSVQRCPQCGAVTDATAATCEECKAPLGDSGPGEFFLPLPPEVPSAGWTGSPAPAPLAPDPASTEDFVLIDEPAQTPTALHRHAEAAVREPVASEPPQATDAIARTAKASTASTARSAVAAVDVAPAVAAAEESVPLPAGAAEKSQPQPAPAAAATTITTASAAPERGSGRGLKVLALLIALGIAAYFGYRHFQRFEPSDAAPSTATNSPAKDLPAPVPAEKPAATPPSAAAAGGASPAAVREGAGGKAGRSAEPARSGPAQPGPTDIFMTTPGSSPPRAQETGKAAAAATQGEVRRPAAAGATACTDAVAALGLCKQENTQGRKPK